MCTTFIYTFSYLLYTAHTTHTHMHTAAVYIRTDYGFHIFPLFKKKKKKSGKNWKRREIKMWNDEKENRTCRIHVVNCSPGPLRWPAAMTGASVLSIVYVSCTGHCKYCGIHFCVCSTIEPFVGLQYRQCTHLGELLRIFYFFSISFHFC